MIKLLKQMFCRHENKIVEKEVFGEDYVYACPLCNSTDIGYFTGLDNYYEVFNLGKEPIYVERANCNNCGFKTKKYEDDCTVELRKVISNEKQRRN